MQWYWTSTCKRMNLDEEFIPFTKINSRWIIGLNVKCKTIKLLEDNIGENLGVLRSGNDLFDNSKSMIPERKS